MSQAASFDLVILAAGLGRRFGGLKQVEPVGPHGELLIEYSAFDALRAGCGRLVLVIRRELEREFRAVIGRRLEARGEVAYVFQEATDLPGDARPAEAARAERSLPWGTGHAVLAARHAVRRPFMVINADDFYGAAGYGALAAHLATSADYALVAYPLRQTLSPHGAVSRGLCATDATGGLAGITETTGIALAPDGAWAPDGAGGRRRFTGDERVSMNFWGFTPAVFGQLEELFAEFLATRGREPKAEFYLPTAVSTLKEQGRARVALVPSADAWFGLTFREDVPGARAAVGALVAAGRYPAPLWDGP